MMTIQLIYTVVFAIKKSLVAIGGETEQGSILIN